jgi:hypothetical protein
VRYLYTTHLITSTHHFYTPFLHITSTRRRSALRCLGLASVGLGDAGAEDIADLLQGGGAKREEKEEEEGGGAAATGAGAGAAGAGGAEEDGETFDGTSDCIVLQ